MNIIFDIMVIIYTVLFIIAWVIYAWIKYMLNHGDFNSNYIEKESKESRKYIRNITITVWAMLIILILCK